MVLKIREINGITPELAETLIAAGLDNADKLLAAAAQPQQRTKLADQLGIDEGELLELVNRADLARIKGIGRIYSDLLEFAGVDTIMELRQRNPDHLYEKIEEVASKHPVRRLPRRDQVHDWVAQAQQLERAIFYHPNPDKPEPRKL